MNKSEQKYASTRRMAEINNAVMKAAVKYAKKETPGKGVAQISSVRSLAWYICAINMIELTSEDFYSSLTHLSKADLIYLSATDETMIISAFASEVI